MNGFSEYDQYDGLGLAELVRRQQVKPGELVEAAISRIEQLTQTLVDFFVHIIRISR